jgi:hypothetical protein
MCTTIIPQWIADTLIVFFLEQTTFDTLIVSKNQEVDVLSIIS